jgi:hypothetical protein
MSRLRWYKADNNPRLVEALFGTRERSRVSMAAIHDLIDRGLDSVCVHGITLRSPSIYELEAEEAKRRKRWPWG